MWSKNWLFEALPLENLIGVIYCSLIECNCQKGSLLGQVIRSGKVLRKHSINGTRKGSPENSITVESHLVYMQCSYAVLYKCITAWTPTCHCNCCADRQYCYRYSPVLIMLSAHRVCVLWNSSLTVQSILQYS